MSQSSDTNTPTIIAEGAEDVVDLLKDEVEVPLKEDEEEVVPKDKDEDEEDEIEVEDKEDEEELDLKDDKEEEIDTPPRKKEITKKYPKFFEEFPWLEKMMYRDRRYQELFGSFDDAAESAEKAGMLDQFRDHLLAGNSETMLSEIKEADTKAFNKLVDNFLPTLAKVDREAYIGVAQDVVRLVITSMIKEANATKNEDIKKALEEGALAVNQHIFGSDEYVPKKGRVEDPEKNEILKERENLEKERYDTAMTEVTTKVNNIIKNTISENIDRKDEMDSYKKKNAVRDALEILDNMIEEDDMFKRHMNKLWKEAKAAKYSQSSKDKIRSTWLGKAKRVLPVAIKKARAEALRGAVSRKKAENDNDDSDRRGSIAPGKPASSSKSGRRQGESELDYLMRD